MNLRPLAIPLAMVVVGTIFGWWLRGSMRTAPSHVAPETAVREGGIGRGFADNYRLPLQLTAGKMSPADFAAALAEQSRNPDYVEGNWVVSRMLKTVPPEKRRAVADELIRRESDQLALFMRTWSEQDPRAALDYLKTLPGPTREIIQRNVVEGLALRDPAAAYAVAITMPAGDSRNDALGAALGELAKSDPERAFELAVQAAGPRDHVRGMMEILIDGVAQRDPMQAVAMVEKMTVGDVRDSCLERVADTWGGMDAAAALAWAGGIKDPKVSRDCILSAARGWFGKEPAEMFAWLARQPAERQQFIGHWMRGAIVNADPEQAIPLVETAFPFNEQDEVMKEISTHWAENDASRAIEWAGMQTDPDLRDGVYRGVAIALLDRDIAEAARVAALITSVYRRGEIYESISESWSGKDPRAAAKWVETLPADKSRLTAAAKVVEKWSEEDPAASAKWARDNCGEYGWRNVADNWVERDPEAAMAWVGTLPAGKQRDMVATSLLRTLFNNDHAAAAKAAPRFGKDAMSNFLSDAAFEWSENDHAAGVQWMTQIPAGEDRDYALGILMERWAEYDSARALQAFSALPGEFRGDTVVSEFIRGIDDRAVRMQWASTIRGGQLRLDTMKNIARSWLKKEPARAQAWIRQAALPEDVRRELLSAGNE